METLTDAPLTVLIWYVSLLDSIPDYVRAMIAGALLALVLRLSQRKVPERDVQFSLSFAKIALVTLAVVPPVVWLLPASRLSVFVEKLEPAAEPAHLAWLAVLAVWSTGFLASATRLLAGYRRAAAAVAALPAVAADHKLLARVRHWQRRLGATAPLTLALSGTAPPPHLPGVRRIVLPRAAEHWPATVTDLLIIQELCRGLKHQGRWHLFAELVACCYWPLPWTRELGARLRRDFHVVTDNLASACYQDPLGYRRALGQLEQRLATGGGDAGGSESEARGRRPGGVTGYLKRLGALWAPRPSLDWDVETLARVHHHRSGVVWTEPGEKLALLIGQAVLVALVVGGVTLKEIPPEVERDYSLTLDPTWMDTAFRTPARYQSAVRRLPASGTGAMSHAPESAAPPPDRSGTAPPPPPAAPPPSAPTPP